MKLDRKEAGQQQPEQSGGWTFRPISNSQVQVVTTMYNTSVQIWCCKAWREGKQETTLESGGDIVCSNIFDVNMVLLI